MDPISGIRWTENQRSGQVPFIDSAKKICVYYTSTELEFAVFMDDPKLGEFENQRQAVQALIDSLDPNQWTIYIRRHPFSQKTKRDPERKLWKHFENYQNVEIIEPTSNIDSYALAETAHLIAHFNSSIGPELIYQGTCPVITMGDNYWEKVDSEFLIRSTEQLNNFLDKPRKVRPKEDAYPWAYYFAEFGESFELVEWIKFRAYINGRHILAKR
jgi:UDP-N-acetylglucosamine 2-epimerase